MIWTIGFPSQLSVARKGKKSGEIKPPDKTKPDITTKMSNGLVVPDITGTNKMELFIPGQVCCNYGAKIFYMSLEYQNKKKAIFF
jgi:hypothetical protein